MGIIKLAPRRAGRVVNAFQRSGSALENTEGFAPPIGFDNPAIAPFWFLTESFIIMQR